MRRQREVDDREDDPAARPGHARHHRVRRRGHRDPPRRPAQGVLRRRRGVFQDPFSSYNPIFKADRVFTMLRSGYFSGLTDSEWHRMLGKSLDAVSLDPGAVAGKYPHQLSGPAPAPAHRPRTPARHPAPRRRRDHQHARCLDADRRPEPARGPGSREASGSSSSRDLSLGHYISDATMILRRGRVVERGSANASSATLHPYEDAPGLGAAAPHEVGRGSRPAPRPSDGSRWRRGPLVEVEDGHFVASPAPEQVST